MILKHCDGRYCLRTVDKVALGVFALLMALALL